MSNTSTEYNMRRKFDEALFKIIRNKRVDNKAYFTQDEYNEQINLVKISKEILKTPGTKRTIKDYRRVRKYDVTTINGRERLIRPVVKNVTENMLHYVTNDELFDILHRTHSSISHGGRNRMVSELKKIFCNVTKEAVMIYLGLCGHCQKKSSCLKKGTINKPILHSAFNSHAQVDLIDMESKSYSGFRFIMVYQDHFTKFIILKPLKSKCAEEVAINLIDIYTTFGAPVILYSKNGQEFVNSVLTEVHAMWNEVKIVRGKPIHSQNQGIVERTNIEKMLCKWMEQNHTKDWPLGLKFIQFQKNCALHSGIGQSPYEALFKCSAKFGLLSVEIPRDEIPNINREEDIENLFNNAGDESEQSESEDEAELDEPWYAVTNRLCQEEALQQNMSKDNVVMPEQIEVSAIQDILSEDNVVKMPEEREVSATRDPLSEDNVVKMPEQIEVSATQDILSEDNVVKMPEQIEVSATRDPLSEDNVVKMPEQIQVSASYDVLSKDNVVKMPEQIEVSATRDPLSEDNIVKMPEQIEVSATYDVLSKDNVVKMPEQIEVSASYDVLSKDSVVKMPEQLEVSATYDVLSEDNVVKIPEQIEMSAKYDVLSKDSVVKMPEQMEVSATYDVLSEDNVVKMPEQTEVPPTHDVLEFITVKQEYDQDEYREPDPLVQCKIEHLSPKREPDEFLTEHVKLEDGNDEFEEHLICEEQDGSSALGLPQEIIPVNTGEGGTSNGDIQSCNVCKIGFTDAKVLKKHVRSEHGLIEKISSFTCDICSKSFKTIHKLRKHLQVHTGVKPYTCEICKKCFTQNDNLQVHMRTHTGERPYVCQICSHRFITKSALKVHYRVHSGERPYKCKICDKAFATSSYLAVHHRGHSLERPFKCDECGKFFKTQQQRKKHKQFHLQKKPLYQCNLCDKTFKQKNSYTIHNKIGCESEKLFRCSYCGKHTADRTGLVRHIRIHTGEKPYCCDICGTKYSDKTGLTRHIRIHTGEKPYGCGICGARYSDQTALISHKRKHTDEKPYHCSECDMYFKSPNNLSRHRKKFHSANLHNTSVKHKEQVEIKLQEVTSK